MTEAVLREVRFRLAEIDQQLATWRRLTEEREHLQELLAWYEENRGQIPLLRFTGPSVFVSSANREAVADKRFHPRPNSNTSRVVEETAKILAARPDGTIPFTELAELIPREIAGRGEHWKEAIRTSIKRAGSRYGITYENGGMIRLIKRSPQAVRA